MHFSIDRSSSISIHDQLSDQIKLAISLGRLRPGETLPSIRDLEQQLHVDKNTVWRVYQQLERGGLIDLKRGKGARVNSEIQPTESRAKLETAEALSEKLLTNALKANIHPSSFLRYFQQYLIKKKDASPQLVFVECNPTEAQFFAQQISELWGVEIKDSTIEELPNLIDRAVDKSKITVLSNIYHIDEIREVLKGTSIEAIGLRLRWKDEMLTRIEGLAEPAHVLFVYKELDVDRYGSLIVEEFRSLIGGRRIRLSAKGVSDSVEIRKLSEKDYDLIFVSNRLWNELPEDLRDLGHLDRPRMQIDPETLDKARIKLGIIW